MPPVYRIAEVVLYSLLNFLPFLALALYPFRRSMRFSKGITVGLIAAVVCVQIFLGNWAAFSQKNNAGLISAVSTVLYAAFYFLAIKKNIGKTLFTLLMISNIANFAVISAKSLEGMLFPELAVQSYRWSFSLMLFAVEAIIALPMFRYMKMIYTPALEKEPSGVEWHYLWLIPATFYLMWYYSIYANDSRSSLEIALDTGNAVFLFFINVGAILIYYVVTKLIAEQNKTLELQERNHLLTMQSVQYENLQERIAEARRAKHDVRHHISLMQEYLSNGELDKLNEYLTEYGRNLPDDTLIRFCENSAVNAVLLYFAQQAKENGIDYVVKTQIPEDISVKATDLSVIFGNLIENAVEACKAENGNGRQIVIRASADTNSLCITVDNTFTGTLKHGGNGNLLSTKHKGSGIGTQSVKIIAEKYGGTCRFEAENNMFYASVLCMTEL